jgi:hypothetical protein
MPRPHRRRREKKLMTMDEVNERFPLTKYKAWVTGREKEGLPAEGGITAQVSRSASLKDAEGVMRASKEQHRSDGETTKIPYKDASHMPTTEEEAENGPSTAEDKRFSEVSALEKHRDEQNGAATGTDLKPSTTTTTSGEEEDEEEDHIQAAVPPELLTNPGDACAICLETLEDEDDVRGLTCGHAFHAGCLDPWLTNRRACCPLCKADYYVPKPRSEAEEIEERVGRRTTGSRVNMPAVPQGAWAGARSGPAFRPRMILPGRFIAVTPGQPSPHDRYGFLIANRERRTRQTPNTENTDVSYTADPQDPPNRTAGSRFNIFRRAAPASAETHAPSPPGEVSYSATSPPTDAEPPEVQAEPRRPRFARFHLPGRSGRTENEDQVIGDEPTPGDLESGRP